MVASLVRSDLQIPNHRVGEKEYSIRLLIENRVDYKEHNREWEDLFTDGKVRFPVTMKKNSSLYEGDPSLRSG
jgi:hypothetical protein